MTKFPSIETAKAIIAALGEVDPESIVDDPELKMTNFQQELLANNQVGSDLKQEIRKAVALQRGFTFIDFNGREKKVIISPTTEGGYECWVLLSNGAAVHL